MDIHNGSIEAKAGVNGSIFILRFPKNEVNGEKVQEATEKAIPLKALYQLSKQGRAIF